MTQEEVCLFLLKKAQDNILYITTRGKKPPGPSVEVIALSQEELDVLRDVQRSLNLGRIFWGGHSNKVKGWLAHDEEAIVVLKMIVPYLKANPGPYTTKRLCFAQEQILMWRRRELCW